MPASRIQKIPSCEITPESLYYTRRSWLAMVGLAGVSMASPKLLAGNGASAQDRWPQGKKGAYDTDEKPSTYKEITSYNNFYEFGTDKSDPEENAGSFKPKPWSVKVDGLVKKPTTFALDDLLKGLTQEDRVYRMRCVEGWSMVIPWRGVQLSAIVKKSQPLASAKYVAFETIFRPSEMAGQNRPYLQWPYVEGLRMDEAMNPLTLLATGLYGKELPNQNGAPLRLVTPWKYGFKGIKSIVRISFVEKEPPTTWNIAAPDEYGFYSNVNPDVDHPRWSQKTERRIGEFGKRKTLPFNGYTELVGSMYAGMDLKKNY